MRRHPGGGGDGDRVTIEVEDALKQQDAEDIADFCGQ